MAAQGKSILIVDDDGDARRFLAVLLEDHGYVTMTASDGEDALEQIEANRPDLITLDVAMPTQSGPRLYKSLRQMDAYREIPIVFVTGVAGAPDEILAAKPGLRAPEGHVTKPVRPAELLAAIRQALRDDHDVHDTYETYESVSSTPSPLSP